LSKENFEKIIQLIFENELLDEEGMLIVEHSKHTKLEHMTNFSFSKNYGGSVFSFYEFENDEEEDFEDEEDEG
jgi:16S rRNA G966 N2-methylase RsmD